MPLLKGVRRFPFVFPDDFFDKAGSIKGSRFVAYYWQSDDDSEKCICENGHHWTDSLNNQVWGEFGDKINLRKWVVDKGVNLTTTKGTNEMCWLVVDMDTKEGYIVPIDTAKLILREQTMDQPKPDQSGIQIIGSKVLAKAQQGTRTILSMHELTLLENGKQRPYFMVTRGDKIIEPDKKKPDAVTIIGFTADKKLVVVNEYRPAIGGREISFPAGMIEEKDYIAAKGNIILAAKLAAIREFFEETGMKLEPNDTSPPRLHSSAGMSDEMSIMVFGEASGEPSKEHCEDGEDIETMLLSHDEIKVIVHDGTKAFSKSTWPLLLMYSRIGLEL